MRVQVVRGSKQEIAEAVAGISGDVREAVVFVEDPSDSGLVEATDDIFAEMEPFTVQAGGADYSRDGIYARQEGE